MRSVCPQAGKKGMTSARLSELYQKVLREALDMVSRVQCRGVCPSHTVIFCRPCPYPPSGGKCLVGRAERAQCVSPAPARRQGGLSVTSGRLEVLECRKRRTSCFPHMALAPRSVGAASGTDAGRCLAGSLGAARLPTRRRAAMAQPQRLPLLGSRPGAAEIGAATWTSRETRRRTSA